MTPTEDLRSPRENDLSKLLHRLQVAFGIFCCDQTLRYVALKSTDTVRRIKLWLEGTGPMPDEVAKYTAGSGAEDAKLTANFAGENKQKIIAAQWAYLDELLSMVDGRIDKILIEGDQRD